MWQLSLFRLTGYFGAFEKVSFSKLQHNKRPKRFSLSIDTEIAKASDVTVKLNFVLIT